MYLNGSKPETGRIIQRANEMCVGSQYNKYIVNYDNLA